MADIKNEWTYRRHKHGNGHELIVLMQVGDFFETYDEDAEKCEKTLGIRITKGEGKSIAGFPKHALAGNIKMLTDADYTVLVLDKDYNESKFINPKNHPNNKNNNSKQQTAMATMKKNFRTVGGGVHYMFDNEQKALVEVKLMREVFNLNNCTCAQEWALPNSKKVVVTHYTPATEEEPEKFDGKMYRTFEDFEKGKVIPIEEMFYSPDNEVRIVQCLVKSNRRYVNHDEKGAFIWTIVNGEAVKWYFREHIDNVRWEYNEKGQITVTSDCETEIPESYNNSEDVYMYNDYRFIDEDGKETVREGVYKRLFLDDDQKKLAEKLQAVIDECNEAKMCIYWSNADYTLNAVNLRKVDRIEYDPCVDEETEQEYYFDDSRAAHVFKNVTDLNSEDSEIKFVIKKA